MSGITSNDRKFNEELRHWLWIEIVAAMKEIVWGVGHILQKFDKD